MKKYLVLLTVILTYLLLVFGSAVAAYGACLGCPDWPLCFGSILPPEQLGAQLEYTHRVLAALTAFSIFGTTFITVKDFKGTLVSKAGILLTLFVLAQIIIGGLTVILKMPFWVSMSHAFFGISTYVLALYIIKGFSSPNISIRFRSFPFLIFSLIFLQVLLGTAVRKANAGFACGQDIFLCLGSELNSYVLLQLSHRIFGYLILLVSIVGMFSKTDRKVCLWITVLLILTIIFGILSVYSLLSPTMVSLHYAIALLSLTLSFLASLR